MHLLAPSITSATGLAAGALLSAVWQGTVLAIAIALCLRLLPGLTATLRSLIWTAALLVIVALHLGPLVNGAAPVTQLGHTSGAVHSLHLNSLWATTLVCLWAALSLLRLISLRAAASASRGSPGAAHRSPPTPPSPPFSSGTVGRSSSASPMRSTGPASSASSPLASFSRPAWPKPFIPPSSPTSSSTRWSTSAAATTGSTSPRSWRSLSFRSTPPSSGSSAASPSNASSPATTASSGSTAARKAYATCLASLAEHAMVRRGLALALGAWERHSELTRRVHRILARPEAAMGRTQAALAATVLFLGLAGGATFLTRCPQLVSFAPAPASTAHIASEETANFNSLQTSHTASLRVASAAATRPAALVQTSMVMDRPPQSTSTTTHRRAVANRVKHPSRGLAPRPSWLTLTRYRQETGSARLVLTNTQFSEPTYAAVPWLNGWLIVQL